MRLSDRFIDPDDYGPYRLSNIPGTIVSALTPEVLPDTLPEDVMTGLAGKYDKVVMILVDGLGWENFERQRAKDAFLRRLLERGKALKLATQFPSTTACNVTTMNTGADVSRHGIFEWFYYEPKVGEMISPLLYSYGKCIHERGSLKCEKGVRPADIYPSCSIYKTLENHGVSCYAFQDIEYAISEYSDMVFEGSKRKGFLTLSDGLVNLADVVINEPAKAYYYFYYDKIDSISHMYGPNSKEAEAETDLFFAALERIFWDRVKDKVDKTLFILTADHGQTTIKPDRCVYLNLEIPGFENYLDRSKSGEPLVPAGSCRDMFLYVKEGYLDDVIKLLRDKLRDIAVVYRTSELVKEGYFIEPYVSEALAGRLGNLVILPFDGECVWWYVKDMFKVDFLGHHGGLTKEEMEIPFMVWEL